MTSTKYFTFMNGGYTIIKDIDTTTPVLWTIIDIAKDLNTAIEIVDNKNNVINLCHPWSYYEDKFYYINVINNTKVWKKIQKVLSGPISMNAKDIEIVFINSRNKTKAIINNIVNNIIYINVYQLDDNDSTPWTVTISPYFLSCITGDDRVIINVHTNNIIQESDLEDQNKLIWNNFKSENMYVWFNINDSCSVSI
jgi:hypothetical protein